MLEVLNTGSQTAEANMRLDEKLLMELEAGGSPLLHLYQWDGPSATYGYFIDPTQYLNLDRAHRHRLSLARRPTGGGIVFHIWDLAFSFLMPADHPRFSRNTFENYGFVNEVVREVMQGFLEEPRDPLELLQRALPGEIAQFCMAKPTIYDVVYQGRKIAGAAQRRRKNGYLHQGTISLALPQVELLHDVLLSPDEVIRAMMAYSFTPLGRHWSGETLLSMRQEIEQRLAENLRTKL